MNYPINQTIKKYHLICSEIQPTRCLMRIISLKLHFKTKETCSDNALLFPIGPVCVHGCLCKKSWWSHTTSLLQLQQDARYKACSHRTNTQKWKYTAAERYLLQQFVCIFDTTKFQREILVLNLFVTHQYFVK